MGRPLITSKFMVSRARSAGKEVSTGGREEGNRNRSPSHPTAAETGTGIRDTVGQRLVNLNETGSSASQGSGAR